MATIGPCATEAPSVETLSLSLLCDGNDPFDACSEANAIMMSAFFIFSSDVIFETGRVSRRESYLVLITSSDLSVRTRGRRGDGVARR